MSPRYYHSADNKAYDLLALGNRFQRTRVLESVAGVAYCRTAHEQARTGSIKPSLLFSCLWCISFQNVLKRILFFLSFVYIVILF